MSEAPNDPAIPDLAAALAAAEIIHDRAAIEASIRAMAALIVADYASTWNSTTSTPAVTAAPPPAANWCGSIARPPRCAAVA